VKKWMRCDSAQMSPALSVLVAIVGICAIVYVYRRVIIDTLLTMLIAIGLFGLVLAALAFAFSSIRWFRRRAALQRATEPAIALAEADRAEMAQDANWLAGGVELAFTPDGKSLVARKEQDKPPA